MNNKSKSLFRSYATLMQPYGHVFRCVFVYEQLHNKCALGPNMYEFDFIEKQAIIKQLYKIRQPLSTE